MWEIIDWYCYLAKDVYNESNYIVRQEFEKNRKWIRAYNLDKMRNEISSYYILGTQCSQCIIRLVDKSWNSFFRSIKVWSKNKGNGYLGRPMFPSYKKKNGRQVLMLKNIQCKIIDGKIHFGWEPLREFSGIKTKAIGKLIQIRFVPCNSCYWMEVSCQVEVPEPMKENNRVAGIDLGINNFATISNNTGAQPIIINGKDIKSINQYFNKIKSEIQSETGMIVNRRIKLLTDKHARKIDYYMHCASKKIVEYCVENSIDTIVLGRNKFWKDEVNMGHVNNQTFVSIPYFKFLTKLKYKCENVGINYIETEESYTSGTSFLDKESPEKENYNKKRRKPRGIFTSNTGIKINSDLNGSYQIIKKVFPNAFEQGDRGWALHPVKVNILGKTYQNS